MKTRFFLAAAITTAVLGATKGAAQPAPEPPVPVVQSPPPAAAAPLPAGEQRLYRPGATLVPPERANQIVQAFGEAYAALDRPRIVIYVNRELVDDSGGLRLTGRTERVETTRENRESTYPAPAAGNAPQTQVNVAVNGAGVPATSAPAPTGPGSSSGETRRVTADNTYERGTVERPALADRQTVRDIERLFGRPLRLGGARLADQRVVAQVIADQPLDNFIAAGSESARRDREALERVADVVIEILVSSRNLTLNGLTGRQTHHVPDIQATAIRLEDGAIIGQASATDVLGDDRTAGPVVRNYTVRDIAEATALALMEDMIFTAPREES